MFQRFTLALLLLAWLLLGDTSGTPLSQQGQEQLEEREDTEMVDWVSVEASAVDAESCPTKSTTPICPLKTGQCRCFASGDTVDVSQCNNDWMHLHDLIPSSWVFSFATNATYALLIGSKVLKAPPPIDEVLGYYGKQPPDVHRQSSFYPRIYWSFFSSILISTAGRPSHASIKLFFGMGDQISGMCLVIIILLVNLQTIWDPPSTSAVELGTINGVVSSIQWADSENKKG
ncbi:hypothetical protein B0H19DRAFT_1062415 [Mycena capillaripes]|nr:hypothetical protein B0H19DRAFT_1062415 [Mycena capillaripes]